MAGLRPQYGEHKVLHNSNPCIIQGKGGRISYFVTKEDYLALPEYDQAVIKDMLQEAIKYDLLVSVRMVG